MANTNFLDILNFQNLYDNGNKIYIQFVLKVSSYFKTNL